MKRRLSTIVIWGALLSIVLFAIFARYGDDERSMIAISGEHAIEMIDAGLIDSQRFEKRQLVLTSDDGHQYLIRMPNMTVIQRLNQAHIPFVQKDPDSPFPTMIVSIGIVVLVVAALIFFLRKRGMGQISNVMELRKSKARPVADADKAKFTDIGGNREARETLTDVVDFLKNPGRWEAAKARLPRGVLMVGPPGTGKTLLARAVAGEANSAFFYTSATEFVEMFVGVGPARIRDTFEKAAAQQPAIIFIDELDAVGRRRGSGVGTMHEEREQTLNQLLVLMDGLERHNRLVVIAATNRLDVLDAALLRSGRFDRVLRLDPPTTEERIEILKIHTRAKPLDSSVSLEQMAQDTEGFTGADLESLTNDAALAAVRRCQTNGDNEREVLLSAEDFDKALKSKISSNRQFDRLDAVLVESVSQFAEPVGKAAARITLSTGTVVEGDVIWMNATHMKLRRDDGSEVAIAKDLVEQIASLAGTELVEQGDFTPDRWAERTPEVG